MFLKIRLKRLEEKTKTEKGKMPKFRLHIYDLRKMDMKAFEESYAKWKKSGDPELITINRIITDDPAIACGRPQITKLKNLPVANGNKQTHQTEDKPQPEKAGPVKKESSAIVEKLVNLVKPVPKPTQQKKWEQERAAWFNFKREHPDYDPPADTLLNLLEGLTPQGFDKNGKKIGPKDSGRSLNILKLSNN